MKPTPRQFWLAFLLCAGAFLGTGAVMRVVNNLQDLSNVRLASSPSNGDALVYNTTLGRWTNGTASGGGYVANSNGVATNLAVYSGAAGVPGLMVQDVGGSLRVAVDSSGNLITTKTNNFTGPIVSSGDNTFNGTNTFSTRLIIGTSSDSSATLNFVNNAGSANIKNSGVGLTFNFNGGNRGFMGTPSGGSSSFQLYSDDGIGWTTSLAGAGASDIGFSRTAAGLVEINTGTVGSYRDLRLRTVELYARPADPSSSATLGQLYAKTNGATTEVYVLDGAGNVTQISPHARASSPAPASVDAGDKTPIVIHHKNLFTGEQEWLHLSALAKEVERLSGKKFVWKSRVPQEEVRDWDVEEARVQRETELARERDLARLADWQTNPNTNKGAAPVVRPAHVPGTKPEFLR